MAMIEKKRDDALSFQYLFARLVSSNYGPPIAIACIVAAMRWYTVVRGVLFDALGWNSVVLLWLWRVGQVAAMVLLFSWPVWLVCRSFYCAMERKWGNLFHSWVASGVAMVLLFMNILLSLWVEYHLPNLLNRNTYLPEARECVLPGEPSNGNATERK